MPSLSEGERAWLATHPIIRLGVDPSWPPFSYFDGDDKLHGVDADFIRLLGERLGIKFQIVHERAWKDVQEKLRRRELDASSGTALTDERRVFLDFTAPYASYPVAIITRTEAPFLVGLGGVKSMRVIAPESHVTTSEIRRDYPELRVILTTSSTEAMQAVSRSQADVTVCNLAVASHVIATEGLTNLKIAGITGYQFDPRFATRNDWPEFAPILDKALASISEPERVRILDRWIPVDYSRAVNWHTLRVAVLWVASVALAIIAVILFWNRRLSVELAARRAAEQRLQARDVQLESANARLRQSNDEKDMLAHMVAHDLKNPLTAIIFTCQMLRTELSGPAADRLTTIRNASDRMMRLLSRLLRLHTIEDQSFSLKLADADLVSLVETAIERQSEMGARKDITFHFDGHPEPVYARVEKDAIEQVLDNLLSNALKFSPLGKQIHVRVGSNNGRMTRLEVEDQGPGICTEDHAKLFGKFARLSARPTGGEPSHGLGLSITKRLVELMHGHISCESTPGEGSKFIVELPAAKGAEAVVNR